MAKFNKLNPLAASMGAAVVASVLSAPLMAAENPFAAKELSGGYMQLADKHGEGKCGEGKCGEGKCGEAEGKDREGKCGEGKCGEGDMKSKAKSKDGEGKCGEGKCGG